MIPPYFPALYYIVAARAALGVCFLLVCFRHTFVVSRQPCERGRCGRSSCSPVSSDVQPVSLPKRHRARWVLAVAFLDDSDLLADLVVRDLERRALREGLVQHVIVRRR